MEVKIIATNIQNIQEALKRAKSHIKDTTPLMAKLSNHLYNITEKSFETQTSPDGIPWSPIKFRKNDKSPDKILFDSGDMQDTFTRYSTKDEAGVGLNALSGNFPYPLTHQFGTNNAWGRGITVDARPFMPIKIDGKLYDDTNKELEQITEDYMKDSIS